MKQRMTTALLAGMAAITFLSLSVARAVDAPPAPSVKPGVESCTVTVPQGEFAQVRIEFDAPVPWTLLATMRDGRIRVDDTIGVLEPGGWLEIKDGKIRGSFRRFITGSSPVAGLNVPAVHRRMHQFEVDGTLTGDAIEGTCKVPTAEATKEKTAGKITGAIVREAVLARENALPAKVSWDSFLGSAGMGTAATPTTTILQERVDRARLAWRSEEPVGQGLAPLTRFMWRYVDASSLRTSCGSFSPVLGDGKVFCNMRVPRPGKVGNHHGNQPIDYETDAKSVGLEKAPLYVNEKGFELADEVVVAIDAASGKNLWRAVVAIGVPNVQGHKERNSDRTPTYADGKVFVPGRAGYVYAFDANTGKPLWQAPCRDAEAIGIIATPEVVVIRGHAGDGLPHWQGLDPRTGAVLWTAPGRCTTWSPSRWVHAGKTHIVAVVNAEPNYEKPAIPQLVCLDPTTGTPLWTTPVPELFSHAGVTVSGDLLMGYFDLSDPATRKKVEGVDEDGALASIGKPSVRAYQLSDKGAEQRWEYPAVGHPYAVPVVVSEKYAFVCSAGEVLFTGKGNMKAAVIEMATGKVTDEQSIPDADGGKYLPCNGGYVEALGNIAYTRIDGTHGGNQFAFFSVSAKGKITAKTPWAPPQYSGRTHTTSYHHPIMYPLADGRMFLRQYDGIYCYDLRAGAEGRKVEEAVRAAGDDAAKVKDVLCALGEDADSAVRQEAAYRLAILVVDGTLGKPTPVMLKILAAAAGCEDQSVNEMVVQALAMGGDALVPVLSPLAKDAKPARRQSAMKAVGYMKGVAVPGLDELLLLALRDTDAQVCGDALKAVAIRGTNTTVFLPELVRLVDEAPAEQAKLAARALLLALPKGERLAVVPRTWEAQLVSLMNLWGEDELLGRVLAAIQALGEDDACRLCTTVLDGEDALKALRACHLLAGLGAKGVPAIPKIEQAKIKWKNSLSFGRAADSAVKTLRNASDASPK